jgi:hypothetical protein
MEASMRTPPDLIDDTKCSAARVLMPEQRERRTTYRFVFAGF